MIDRRALIISGFASLAGFSLIGCGGSGSDNGNGSPATRLRSFPTGGTWFYDGYPYTQDRPFSSSSILLVLPGSQAITDAGLPDYDVGDTSVLVRINRVVPYSSVPTTVLVPTNSYGGTFYQDVALGDVYLTRLPTGEKLDTPAKILPGTWSRDTVVSSTFLVNGVNKGSYLLVVVGQETLTIRPSAPLWVPCWKVVVTVNGGPLAGGTGDGLAGAFWYAPEYGSYLQAIPDGKTAIDRKFTGYDIIP